MGWLKDLLDDELELCGLLAMLALIGLSIWNHAAFSAREFAESAGIILAGVGGSKYWRDGRNKPPQGDSQ